MPSRRPQTLPCWTWGIKECSLHVRHPSTPLGLVGRLARRGCKGSEWGARDECSFLGMEANGEKGGMGLFAETLNSKLRT